MPATDSYIEKEAIINEEIDRLRLSATRSLFERRDVVIVASVSCIYGLGSPEAYYGLVRARSSKGQQIDRDEILRQARRDPVRAQRPRVQARHVPRARRHRRGLSVVRRRRPAHRAVRRRDRRARVVRSADRPRSAAPRSRSRSIRSPTSSTPRARTMQAIEAIKAELTERLAELEGAGRVLEAQRLHQRTMFDLEMIKEIGYCHGIENYSRHLSGRLAGRAAADAARLPARRRAHHRRREPSDRAAGPRHVPRRSVAQGSARRARLPAAVGARQPAAELRGVGRRASDRWST